MTMPNDEPGFRVTLKDVYKDVQDLKSLVTERLPEDVNTRLRKVEAQVAAQWVVVGIIILGLGSLITRALTGI